jgi:hypothetical protein
LDRPDEHIPWKLPALPRPDLAAAAHLLARLPEDGGPWNLRKFPGALWDASNLRLVVPLPAWEELNDLAALRPLIQDLLGFVDKLEILPVHFDPTAPYPTAEKLTQLKSKLAGVMTLAQFAVTDNIGVARDIWPN